MSVYWSLGGGGRVESRLTCGSILKLLLAIAGGNFPIFVVTTPLQRQTKYDFRVTTGLLLCLQVN